MAGWECAIEGCGRTFDDLEEALAHQVRDHEAHECLVCGSVVPEGFFAVKHGIEDHTRAEYVRHYDADADDIRRRERLLDVIGEEVDVDALRERIAENRVGDRG